MNKAGEQQQTANMSHGPTGATAPASVAKRGQITVPNALSALRILLVGPFLVFYLKNQIKVAVIIFAVAAVSDFLDGALARLLKQRTSLGATLDPLADKLLALASLAALVAHHRLPLWLFILSLARDMVVLVIAMACRRGRAVMAASPSRVGKYATFFTNTAVILALVDDISYSPALSGYTLAMALVAGECLIVASIQYCMRFMARSKGLVL